MTYCATTLVLYHCARGLENSPVYSGGDSAETYQDVTETSMSDGESSVDSEPSLADLELW